jgi:23S rRNA (guanosine2251-2'-O)-methyltransferase
MNYQNKSENYKKNNKRNEDRPRREERRTEERPAERTEESRVPEDLIIGRNAVLEVLKSGRPVDSILMAKGERSGSLTAIAAKAREMEITIKECDGRKLDAMCGGAVHQGVAAVTAVKAYAEMEDLFAAAEAKGEAPFFVLADEVEDPHNLGALIRSAEAAGAHGIIIPKRRAVGLTWTVGKASAGAVEYLPVVRVANMTATVEELKARGVWVYAADMDGEPWCQANLTGAVALVVGGENHGVGRLVKEKCDGVLSLPMCGKVNSLNASVAGGILMYEIARQRLGLKAR